MVNSNDLICDFVNTLHIDPAGTEEELRSPSALAEWLTRRGLLEDGRATGGDLARAIELREALRLLLLEHNEVEVDTAGAWAALDEAACRGRVQLRCADGAPSLAPGAPGVAGALGRLVAAVHEAVA